MPAGRPRNNAKHLHAAVNGLVSAMEGLLATLGASGPKLPPEMRHAPRAAKAKLAPAVKSSWANYTPAQRAARIAAMKAGHAKRKRALAKKGWSKAVGKVATRPGPKKAPASKPAGAVRKIAKQPAPKKAPVSQPAARKSAWASMSPEQRAERVAKMQAGRG